VIVQEQRAPGARFQGWAILAYALLVVCLWAWYALNSGMGYESSFALESEAGDRGRHFGDNMRRFTTFFYHLAYVTGDRLGIAGSYVPYQVIYALLWFLRGLLVYQIVRMLGVRQGTTAFLAGAFTILHAADSSLNWVGQLNQFGFIFWMLLSFVALLKAFRWEHRLLLSIPMAIVAAQCARICIYSYESPLPLVFAFPFLVLVLFLGFTWRKGLITCIYLSLPVQYCWRWLHVKLDRSIETTYQFSVLRQDWAVTSILRDWIYNIWHSLAFWQWPRTLPDRMDVEFVVVTGVCALAAATAVVALLLLQRPDLSGDGRLEKRLLALGIAMATLSFPAYLLLDSATTHWRTQLLSSPGAGIALASATVLLAGREWRSRNLGKWLAAALAGAIALTAVWSAQGSAFRHRGDWEKHRSIVSAMIAAAPRVADNTVVILVNRRDQPLIFGHNLWWDYAVRLAYPTRLVTGIYYEKPGQIAAGVKASFADAYAFVASEAPILIEMAKLDQLLVLEALPDGRIAVSSSLPDWLGVAPRFRDHYQPQTRILALAPDERAVRRFGPIERE
jgi:hypothetical protein